MLGITDPWAGYYDTTENYIGGSGLSEATIDRTTLGFQTPGKWTWAWRGDSDASDTSGYNYMNLGLNSAISPPGSAPSASVYDLELYNLYPGNAGDFESSGNLPANWSLVDGPTPSTWVEQTLGLQIHGNRSIKISTDTNGYAAFALNTIADQSPSPTVQHIYSWRFYLGSGSTYVYQIGPTFKTTDLSATTVTEKSDVRIADISLDAASNANLIFGGSSPLTFTMDDVRIIRQDIDGDFGIRLLLRPSDATHILRSGYYEFTLWVKKPSGDYFVWEDPAKMTYAASRVTLAMLPQGQTKGTGAQQVFPIDGNPYDAGAGWVQLTLRMKDGDNFFFDSSSTNPVMELAIFPFDTGNRDPGLVEIADPQLHYYKDGY
ncbi:MAG TPA: hypothetical protein VMV83_01770 [Rectinemataceae bacterium]|nr:hypothetical protein [Rectinemataceae bacterium]